METSGKSCAVALPSERNNATSKINASASATTEPRISRKPASILELRAQLVAQQKRNYAASIRATLPPKVAVQVAPEIGSYAVALSSDVKEAASQAGATSSSRMSLIDEFIEVDGMSRADAEALADQCHTPRPAAEWMSMIAELDDLIAAACKRYALSLEACNRIMAVRRSQSLASIPEALQWLRQKAKS